MGVPHPKRLYFQKEELIWGSASGTRFTLFLHGSIKDITSLKLIQILFKFSSYSR
jgi:hypothetical protein